MRYAIVIEKAEGNYSACVPDLPGCIAAAATVEAEAPDGEIRKAIRFHIDGLRDDGLPIPSPTGIAEYADIDPSSLALRKRPVHQSA
jgi:predicted RNase H-like HicB family nuclease